MNDRDLLDLLDRRGRTAADDLTVRAAARPRPPAPVLGDVHLAARTPARLGTPRRRVLAIAAAVLVLAAGAAGLALRDHRDDDKPADVISTDPPPYVATDLPKGYTAAGVSDPPALDVDLTPGDLGVYGPSGGRPELGIQVLTVVGAGLPGEAPRIAVGGRTGYRLGDGRTGPRQVVVPVGRRFVYLMSPTVGFDRLAAAGAHVHVHGLEVDVDAADLPAGWTKLGSTPAGTVLVGAGAFVQTGSGKTASYSSAAPRGGGLVYVRSATGDALGVEASRIVVGTARDARVRGHHAVLGQTRVRLAGGTATLPVRTLIWLEAPGHLVAVTGYNLSERDLIAVAAGVRPATPSQWNELERRTRLNDFDSDNATSKTIGTGRFADGQAWKLRFQTESSGGEHQPQPTPHLDIARPRLGNIGRSYSGHGPAAEGDEGPDELTDPDERFTWTEVVSADGRRYADGFLAGPVADVVVRDRSGRTVATAEIVTGQGVRAWVVVLPADARSVVALDAGGVELGDITV